jgi:hypothetical protein
MVAIITRSRQIGRDTRLSELGEGFGGFVDGNLMDCHLEHHHS